MCTTVGSTCKKILWINQTVLKMWLWMWIQIVTNKIWNLELLLGAVDLAKFLVMENFKHYELNKAMEHNRIGFRPVMTKVPDPYLFKGWQLDAFSP